MPPASNEEQFKFLISCIRWSNSGKVDFGEVARECSIVTKGAAAKRYERMMKAHGIAPNAASVRAGPAARIFKAERKESSSPTKKRKMDDFANDGGAMADDDEQFENIKPDPENQSEQLYVKEETSQILRGAGDLFLHFMPPLNGSNQDYLRANTVFEQNAIGSDTHSNQAGDANISRLSNESTFLPFSGFEHAIGNDEEQNVGQGGGHQQDIILIAD